MRVSFFNTSIWQSRYHEATVAPSSRAQRPKYVQTRPPMIGVILVPTVDANQTLLAVVIMVKGARQASVIPSASRWLASVFHL